MNKNALFDEKVFEKRYKNKNDFVSTSSLFLFQILPFGNFHKI